MSNKYTSLGKVTITENENKKIVSKEKNEDANIKGLFTYLNSRNFNHYPNLISDERKEVDEYEFIEDVSMPTEQKAEDLIDVICNLHHKTNYFKEVSEDTFKEVYLNIESNINYLIKYYDNLFDKYVSLTYQSSDVNIFMNNYSKLYNSLNFCLKELSEWYDLVKKETKQRVVVVHNNLSLDHFLKSLDKEVLISWDNHKVDTPVLDLFKFYKNEYLDVNFEVLLKRYENNFPLLDSERKLLFILISLPPKIEFNESIFKNCISVRYKLDYIFKTEKLIRPYYSKEEEE